MSGALATAVTLGLLAGTATAGTPTMETTKPRKAKESSLTGFATMDRGKNGDRVTFSFDAHGFAPANLPGGTSRGTFRFSHHSHDGTRGATFEGRIDCLLTGGPVATATGIITRSDHHDGRVIGKRVGFTVYDHGTHDRLGYSWAVDDIPKMNVPQCLSAAPYETVKGGDFTVQHVLPPTPGTERER
ncbi:hypothetical protein ACWC2K_19740 [Streptomyces chattanoogensis]